jgi:MFS family permease
MYSISTNFYPDNKESMVGYIEAVTGVGLIMGPLIGSFLYALGGYKFIFYAFGLLFLVSSFFIKAIFPETIDKMGIESAQT